MDIYLASHFSIVKMLKVLVLSNSPSYQSKTRQSGDVGTLQHIVKNGKK